MPILKIMLSLWNSATVCPPLFIYVVSLLSCSTFFAATLKFKTSSFISVKFHNTIIYCIFELAKSIRDFTEINKIVLSGGSFQNAYILEKTEQLLRQNDFSVYSHKKVPTNDAGIALGQLVIAAKRKQLKLNKN